MLKNATGGGMGWDGSLNAPLHKCHLMMHTKIKPSHSQIACEVKITSLNISPAKKWVMDCKYSLNALTSKSKTIHHKNVGAKWIACFSKDFATLFQEPFCRILSVSFVCAHGPSVENDGGGMGMPASCDTSDGSVSPNGLQ